MWKYESGDIDNISLHDYLIDELLLKDNDIILILHNGFGVLKTHSLNDTGQSKRTSKAQIVLKGARLLSGKMYLHGGEEREFSISMVTSQFLGFEIFDVEIECNMFVLAGRLLENPIGLCDCAELSFHFNDVVFCWNEYVSNTWFDDGLPHNK